MLSQNKAQIFSNLLGLLPRGDAWQSSEPPGQVFTVSMAQPGMFQSGMVQTLINLPSVLHQFWAAVAEFFAFIYARFDAASDPTIVLTVGFVLIVAIYVQTAILYGVYTPELFPTEIRLRANGICNMFGRGATVVSPFVVGSLMQDYKLPGVIWLMIGLVVVQILVVWAWGIEPRNRGLEDVAAKT